MTEFIVFGVACHLFNEMVDTPCVRDDWNKIPALPPSQSDEPSQPMVGVIYSLCLGHSSVCPPFCSNRL